ncbi:MAG: hypothetical protein HS116_21110 [Planctomycetes bacterium]|nr:hypothetical protein [Planctomycetota bacterium]
MPRCFHADLRRRARRTRRRAEQQNLARMLEAAECLEFAAQAAERGDEVGAERWLEKADQLAS